MSTPPTSLVGYGRLYCFIVDIATHWCPDRWSLLHRKRDRRSIQPNSHHQTKRDKTVLSNLVWRCEQGIRWVDRGSNKSCGSDISRSCRIPVFSTHDKQTRRRTCKYSTSGAKWWLRMWAQNDAYKTYIDTSYSAMATISHLQEVASTLGLGDCRTVYYCDIIFWNGYSNAIQ